MEDKASEKAIDRISPELQAKLDGRSATLPKVKVQDGKVVCPGCSQEAVIDSPAANMQYTQVQGMCKSCKTEFIAIADAVVPDGSGGPTETPTGPPEPSMEHGSNPTYRLGPNQAGGHEHAVQLNHEGDAVSGRVNGHVHIVKSFKAQPGDGHTHPVEKTKPGEAGNLG
jgi:hypothetical protein